MSDLYLKIINWFIDADEHHEYSDYGITSTLYYGIDIDKSKKSFDTYSKQFSHINKKLYQYSKYNKNDLIYKNAYYYVGYNSHGERGGSCWGDEAHSYHHDEPNNFNMNDITYKLSNEFFPNITYCCYINILKECITKDTTYESGYYGNGDGYTFYMLDIKKMVDLIETTDYGTVIA